MDSRSLENAEFVHEPVSPALCFSAIGLVWRVRLTLALYRKLYVLGELVADSCGGLHREPSVLPSVEALPDKSFKFLPSVPT